MNRIGPSTSSLEVANADGNHMQPVVATPSLEDALVLSPGGSKGAYVSTSDGYKANIRVVDLSTGNARHLTGDAG